MKFLYCMILFLFLWRKHCFGQYDFRTLPQEYRDQMGNVSQMLNVTTPLVVVRAKYKEQQHPICMRSQRIDISTLGFHHNLTYYMKASKGQPGKAKGWKVRETYLYVGPKNKFPSVYIAAYMDAGKLDPEVSGDYYIFYGHTPCFVVGTGLLQANSWCLLWEVEGTFSTTHESCLKAFDEQCTRYPGYEYHYRKGKCDSRISTEP
uniref:Putative secreted peptide n=1 Tax=Rhipicephalus pulchellus TaxID=72859 RepID=L7M9F0_RHIPC